MKFIASIQLLSVVWSICIQLLSVVWSIDASEHKAGNLRLGTVLDDNDIKRQLVGDGTLEEPQPQPQPTPAQLCGGK